MKGYLKHGNVTLRRKVIQEGKFGLPVCRLVKITWSSYIPSRYGLKVS